MKNHPFLALSLAAMVFTGAAKAAEAYQVTGPILEVTDSKIVVEKGKEKWEIARTADTKVTGDLKVGSKVTVQYKMTATSIESKEKPAAKEPAKEKTKEEKPAPAKKAA